MIENSIKAIAKNNKLIGRVEGLKWVLDHIQQSHYDVDPEALEFYILNHIEGLLAEWEEEKEKENGNS